MANQKIIALLKEKINTANFNNNGIATISVKEIGDEAVVKEALKNLEADCTLEINFDPEAMTLKLHNLDDDIEGFVSKHPSPQKCVEKN
ncbi:hypothetical protein [Acetobacterium sp.]|uniref:hypothetical protein n=1 Tax=Acetobacterium sp. TaxID=1872094 RepID=UPI002F40B9A4